MAFRTFFNKEVVYVVIHEGGILVTGVPETEVTQVANAIRKALDSIDVIYPALIIHWYPSVTTFTIDGSGAPKKLPGTRRHLYFGMTRRVSMKWTEFLGTLSGELRNIDISLVEDGTEQHYAAGGQVMH